LKTYKAENKKV